MPNYISYPEQNSGNGWKWAFFFLLLLVIGGIAWFIWRDQKDSEEASPTPSPIVTVSVSPLPTTTPSTSAKPTATKTPKPSVSVTPAPNQAEKNQQIEALLFQYTNAERAKNGLPALKSHNTLITLARNHSNDMAKNNFFGHVSSTGKDPWARAADVGIVIAAENIAKMGLGKVQGVGLVTNTPESVAQAQFKVWMGSTGHRENILSSSVTELGVGTAFDGSFYLPTQIYR